LLLEHWEGPRVVEVEGPDRVSPALIASTLTRLLARDVRAKLVPREDWESTFRSTGMKNPAPRILMLDGFNHGWIEFEAGQAGSRKTKTPLAKALGHLVEASTSESDRDENIS
jgi:NAD(P)H dehydrogenase (quinone)